MVPLMEKHLTTPSGKSYKPTKEIVLTTLIDDLIPWAYTPANLKAVA